MITKQKVEHVGELIRQLRRQRNLTQSALGANRYSKSYVSAVEKNTLRPISGMIATVRPTAVSIRRLLSHKPSY